MDIQYSQDGGSVGWPELIARSSSRMLRTSYAVAHWMAIPQSNTGETMAGPELLSDKVVGAAITTIIGLIGWAIQRWLEPGARLGYWIPHDFIFNVRLNEQANPLNVQTSTLTVQNFGRKAAEKIEIIHANKPDHFQIHPRRDYEEHAVPDGTHIIGIESLGPKEFLHVQILSHLRAPQLVSVRSKDGQAKSIRFQVFRVFPRPVVLLIQFCMLVGAFAILYWIVRAVIFVSRANGMI